MAFKTKAELLAAIDADKESHIRLLQKLIQAPSPNPPGDTRAAAKVITDFLTDRSIPYEIIAPGGEELPNIVSSFFCSTSAPTSSTSTTEGEKRGKNIVMNGHLDVFPVSSTETWKHGSPWSGHNDGTSIYGRGGVDMKAGTLASVIAYSYLYTSRTSLTSPTSSSLSSSSSGSVTLTAVSDEETGGKYGSKYLLYEDPRRAQWRGDVMINAEPGGMESIRFAEKGTLRITFTIRTPGAHGAYLHLSEGANRVAARFITSLLEVESIVPPDLPKEIKEFVDRQEVRECMDVVMGKGAGSLALKPTVNIGVLKGGVKVNTIPSECEIQADIRLPIGLTKETVLEFITTKILPSFPEGQVEMKVQEAASNPSSYCDPQHEMVGILKKNAEELGGKGMRVTPIPSLGATDTKFWRYVGVPAYVYGVSPESMASVDERVKIEEFLRVLKVHAASVWEFFGGNE